MSQINFVEMEL